MSLQPGQQLSHYRVVEQIGEGGMGVVWKAIDTTLDREVAIKVLPTAFAGDVERLARFEREAKSLASLNHPNIAAIHSVHEADGVRFLAMELVPGEDLSRLIARGALPIDRALEIAWQIATALEAAHASGIVHRDLKPANVKLTPDNKVKVLDFGLAKAWATDPATNQNDPSLSPTLTSAGTMVGVILGTASYMSPEQARGRQVDQRADLWALGVILFEMLTGRVVFSGEDVSEVLAGVIKSDPDWEALPAALPTSTRFVLRRCLERKLEERLHSAADLRILLDESRGELEATDAAAVPQISDRRLAWLPWVLFGTASVAALFGFWWLRAGGSSGPGEPVRFQVDAPVGGGFAPAFAPFFDVTSDGRTIVYAALDPSGARRLYARELDSTESYPIAGTEGAEGPFISPDGVIGFVAQSQLRITSLGGLGSREICDSADAFYGGSFTPDGWIVFNDDIDTGLKRVPADGGSVEPLTTPDRDRLEIGHTKPYVLPSGRGVLFTINRTGDPSTPSGTDDTALLSLETGDISIVMEDTNGPYRYLPSGHLLMLRAGRLIALPFDDASLEQTGAPFKFFGDEEIEVAVFAVSARGTLVVSNVTPFDNQGVVWVDRQGIETPIPHETGMYYPSLSPNGEQLAVTHAYQTWILQLDGGRRMRLTQEGRSFVSLFSPDGGRVVFGSYQPEENLYWMASDGSGEMELLLDAENRQYPLDWHEPSNRIVAQWTNSSTGYDIWTVSATDDPVAEPLLDSPYNEQWAQLSPDGRWIAYASNESGRYEIYVRSFPDGGGKLVISTNGGIEPRWSPRGDEIFFKGGGDGNVYRSSAEMMVVPVTLGAELKIGTPQRLFQGDYVSGMCCGHSYDVTSDGARFVMIKTKPESERRLTVVLNALRDLGG